MTHPVLSAIEANRGALRRWSILVGKESGLQRSAVYVYGIKTINDSACGSDPLQSEEYEQTVFHQNFYY